MKRTIVSLLASALLAGCAAGPDFERPAAPAVSRYTERPLAAMTASAPGPGGDAQRYIEADVAARWWTAFGSDALNELVAAALAANPDLQAAEAALRAARESEAAQRGAFAPNVDLRLTPSRQKVADALSSPTASGSNLYTFHTVQLSVGYVPDVFGGIRREAEAAGAQTDLARAQYQAARLTLVATVVGAAINEASLRAQLQAMNALVDSARRQLDAVRRQQRAGQLGAADVALQEAALAQAEAGLPPLEKQLAQQRNQLAVLAGRPPSDGVRQGLDFEQLQLARQLPLNLPARLIERRPDIQGAEAVLHAASAKIGVAQAARLPNISLSATLGGSALSLGTLFKSGAGFWSIGADLVQPIFQGGTLRHQQRAAEAAYEQAAAQYRGVVLTAFQNVADALEAIDADARALRAADAAEQAARKSLSIARQQWKLGAVAYPAILQAEQAYQQTSVASIQARTMRYTDTVALFQALGGDWGAEK